MGTPPKLRVATTMLKDGVVRAVGRNRESDVREVQAEVAIVKLTGARSTLKSQWRG